MVFWMLVDGYLITDPVFAKDVNQSMPPWARILLIFCMIHSVSKKAWTTLQDSKMMDLEKLHVCVLVDQEIIEALKEGSKEAAMEMAVLSELGSLVRRTTLLPFTSAFALSRSLERLRPDVVFNLTEHAHRDRSGDAQIAAVLELLRVPFTGCSAMSLMICRDKALSKLIALQAGLFIPRFFTVGRAPRLQTEDKPSFPVIVKPRFGDGSDGISKRSLCTNDKVTTAQTKEIVRRYSDAIVEEFVKGREICISFLTGRLCPPRELIWSQEESPKIFTAKIKHNRKARLRANLTLRTASFDPVLTQNLRRRCTKAFGLFDINSYGRMDLIISGKRLFFLEVNPNPGLALKESILEPWGRLSRAKVIMRILEHALLSQRQFSKRWPRYRN
jgi:D-alanine-D-alanine ligase